MSAVRLPLTPDVAVGAPKPRDPIAEALDYCRRHPHDKDAKADLECMSIDRIAARLESDHEGLADSLLRYGESLSLAHWNVIAATLTRTELPKGSPSLGDVCRELARIEYDANKTESVRWNGDDS